MNEAQFQKSITDLCDWLRLKWHHETDSRKSKAGFPDLVIVGDGVVYAELKTETGRVSTAQQEWIDRLTAAGAEIHVWRPQHLNVIRQRLHQLAGRTERTQPNA